MTGDVFAFRLQSRSFFNPDIRGAPTGVYLPVALWEWCKVYAWYWFRANRVERLEAQREAILLTTEHGDRAIEHVRSKLRSPRRKRSAVELKLTICLIARRRKATGHRRRIWATF